MRIHRQFLVNMAAHTKKGLLDLSCGNGFNLARIAHKSNVFLHLTTLRCVCLSILIRSIFKVALNDLFIVFQRCFPNSSCFFSEHAEFWMIHVFLFINAGHFSEYKTHDHMKSTTKHKHYYTQVIPFIICHQLNTGFITTSRKDSCIRCRLVRNFTWSLMLFWEATTKGRRIRHFEVLHRFITS